MSSGVDSSVAALLLKERGYDVIGASMNLLTCHRDRDRSCCSAEDRRDARLVCSQLNIPYHVFDYRALFREKVIAPFVEEYLEGRTPSPCILCNEHLKFSAFFEEADRLGARYVATGHYARIVQNGDAVHLLKGMDAGKDQSYFLFPLKQKELSRLLFPLGEMTKDESRNLASAAGLSTHEKPESQDICFIQDDDYVSFVEEAAGSRLMGPGNFVDRDGTVLGRHGGIHAYTIGQRRGLGFGLGRRQYVVKIDPGRNEVVLGNDDDLKRSELVVRNVSWVRGDRAETREASVKIRSTHDAVDAGIEVLGDDSVIVHFREPVRAIAPGQAAVFYDGDEVLGGGWIA